MCWHNLFNKINSPKMLLLFSWGSLFYKLNLKSQAQIILSSLLVFFKMITQILLALFGTQYQVKTLKWKTIAHKNNLLILIRERVILLQSWWEKHVILRAVLILEEKMVLHKIFPFLKLEKALKDGVSQFTNKLSLFLITWFKMGRSIRLLKCQN